MLGVHVRQLLQVQASRQEAAETKMELDARSRELDSVLLQSSGSNETSKVSSLPECGILAEVSSAHHGRYVPNARVYLLQVQCLALQQQLQAKQEDLTWLQAKCQSHQQLVDAVEGANPSVHASCRHAGDQRNNPSHQGHDVCAGEVGSVKQALEAMHKDVERHDAHGD